MFIVNIDVAAQMQLHHAWLLQPNTIAQYAKVIALWPECLYTGNAC